jgi:NAD(P)-dependent dehydrogenase (short-subunit alcohol dehydrogenase family)
MSAHQKVLLLTGASRGIGHATVRKFSDNGWRVLTVSRHPFDDRCPWEGGASNHIQLDLADVPSIYAAIPELKRVIGGRLDALINNAAISPKKPDGSKILVLDLAYQEWLHVFNVNLFASVILTSAFRDELSIAKGSVVNITSIVGVRVHPFASAAYATSKAALAALTREMAVDFGESGVRVNAVSPGEIETAILSPGTQQMAERQIPLRRLGRPKEVANLLAFLCSDQASYITGAELNIDGGQRI